MYVKDIPREFWEDSIVPPINHHSIAILASKTGNPSDPPELRGSGSLVQYNDMYFILTAQHVIKHLKPYPFISFVFGEEIYRMMHKSSLFTYYEVATPLSDVDGPDVGLISIPEIVIGRFIQKKSFVNLGNKDYLTNHESLLEKNGLWIIAGAVGELTKLELEKERMIVALMCYAGGTPNLFGVDDYDYYEMETEYKPDTMTPNTFGGMSGGGLWKLRIAENKGSYELTEQPKLIGINYHESDRIENIRTVRGHGPKTIYSVVKDYVDKFV